MRLLTDLTPLDPALGLAIEEVLLESVRTDGVETIRLWRNSRAVILGRSQSLSAEVDQVCAAKLDIPILRRISGGGTVYHYPGNLNVSLFLRKRSQFPDVSSVFTFFGTTLCNALGFLSIDIHAQDNGLYIGDEKVGGAAQAHRGVALLYHTTLLVRESSIPLETLLSAMRPGYRAEGIASRPRSTTSLSAERTVRIEPQELVTPIVDALACALDVDQLMPGALTSQESQRSMALQTTKYGSTTWNAKL
jgi:lipoate---protein ligase